MKDAEPLGIGLRFTKFKMDSKKTELRDKIAGGEIEQEASLRKSKKSPVKKRRQSSSL